MRTQVALMHGTWHTDIVRQASGLAVAEFWRRVSDFVALGAAPRGGQCYLNIIRLWACVLVAAAPGSHWTHRCAFVP